MIKLNLGCEDKILPGFVNVDVIPREGIKVMDLNKKKLNFKSDYAEYFLISHLIEYLDSPADFLHEIWRIGKKGAKVDLIVDHFSFGLSYAEPRHRRAGFSYFMFGNKNWNKEFQGKFRLVRKRLNFTRRNFKFLNRIINPIVNRFPMLYERLFCYVLPCSEVWFRLEIVKD